MKLKMLLKNYAEFIKNTEEPLALVLGRYMTLDIGVVRSLSKKNIPLFVLNPMSKPVCSFSKYYRGTLCPHPKHDEKKYIEFLLEFGEKLNTKAVLIPVGDIEVSVILRNKSKLEKYYNFYSSDINIVEKFLNKRLFYKTIEKHGISRPKTYILNDESDAEETSKKIDYPCILKPVYSDYFRSEFKIKLFKIESKEELIKKYKTAAEKGHEVVAQEIIPGGAISHYGCNVYYNKNQQPNGVFMYRRIREWPHSFGNGCLIESVQVPELEEITTELAKKVGYHGIIDAEFKKDPRDNKFKIIEINPRCWMQNSFPTRCGINFPYMAYMDAIGKDFEKQVYNGKHVKWLYMPEDILSSLKSIKKRELSLNDWIKSYKGERKYAIFSWDDPLPFFAMFINLYRWS